MALATQFTRYGFNAIKLGHLCRKLFVFLCVLLEIKSGDEQNHQDGVHYKAIQRHQHRIIAVRACLEGKINIEREKYHQPEQLDIKAKYHIAAVIKKSVN